MLKDVTTLKAEVAYDNEMTNCSEDRVPFWLADVSSAALQSHPQSRLLSRFYHCLSCTSPPSFIIVLSEG